MDAITLDRLIAELRPVLVGAFVARPRLVGPYAVALEISRERERRLRIDAGARTAGILLVPRADAAPATELPARSRHALLLFRKHLSNARLAGLERMPGERWLRLDLGASALVLRLSGSAPALTLVRDGLPLATIGAGAPAWPLPPASPEAEWDRIEPMAVVAAAATAGRPAHKSVSVLCPGLGPELARVVAAAPKQFPALRERLRHPVPTLLSAAALDSQSDRELGFPGAVTLLPLALERPGMRALEYESFNAAGLALLRARRRGDLFEALRARLLGGAREEIRRLSRLLAGLGRDLGGLPEADSLRRQAEALLAFAKPLAPGAEEVEVSDPYDTTRTLRVRVDPLRSGPANADRLFDRARRIERARREIETRLTETRRRALLAERREARAAGAQNLADLEVQGLAEPVAEPPRASGPRHYLTSRGLSVLVGRGARENQELTFHTARPEDRWLHARGVPGSHVILRDPEGRASADDVREAAEIAAYCSEASAEARIDVHVVRRKHVRPARGGAGRVNFSNAETLRVAPRDPEGRLRRR